MKKDESSVNQCVHVIEHLDKRSGGFRYSWRQVEVYLKPPDLLSRCSIVPSNGLKCEYHHRTVSKPTFNPNKHYSDADLEQFVEDWMQRVFLDARLSLSVLRFVRQ